MLDMVEAVAVENVALNIVAIDRHMTSTHA
jgi:hypothetical protein